jgi:transcriptional regulator with XRE-family HTH domain
MTETDIMPELCRAARGLLGWGQDELARRAEVAAATIRGYERGQKVPRRASLAAIQHALEQAGVTFACDSERGMGAFVMVPDAIGIVVYREGKDECPLRGSD